jgi:ribonuclease D
VLVTTHEQLKEALKEIYKHKVLGFDTETKPAFRKGEYNSVSLLQIAVEGIVYIIRLNLTGFTRELTRLFGDPSILKVGISIRDDIKELKKLREFEPDGIIELNTIAKSLEVKHEGVRNLSAVFLNIRISKTQQTTNWEREELNEKQLRYAATDAWVCLEIYNKLGYKGYV